MSETTELRLFPDDARSVLAFWFDQDPATFDREIESRARGQTVRKAWFQKSEAFDALCPDRFGALVESALGGGLDDWDDSAASALARIILLDQLPRNIFRGSARAFAGDNAALASAKQLVARGALDHLTPQEQVFALLPFEHHEAMPEQDEAVRLFEALAAREPSVESNADYARRHRVVIARFGRFPHRNAVLGRTSTPEEAAFLEEPNSSF